MPSHVQNTAPFNQCENSDSLCEPQMLQHGIVTEGTLDGVAVDNVDWVQTLVVASETFKLSVAKDTTTPIQLYNTFEGGIHKVGYSQINFTNFKPGTPEQGVFIVPNQKYSESCDPQVCNTAAANVKAGMHLIHAFDWKTQFGLEL